MDENKNPPDVPQTTDILLPEGRHDIANARRFVEDHGKDVKYVTKWKTFAVWDGRCWCRDDCQTRIDRLAKRTARRVWREIKGTLRQEGDREEKERLKFGRQTSSAGGISSMLRLVRSEPEIAIKYEALDTHDWLLNCENGTVDLRTGQLLPHDRTNLITKLCPVSYDPSAPCPRWEQFASEVMGRDKDKVDFLQRYVGMSLTGSVREQVLLICWGEGANGKSTFWETLLSLLGSGYAGVVSDDLLIRKKKESHPCELIDLFGRRLCVSTEIDAGREINEAKVKRLTGGDKIQARGMHENFWSFAPTHKNVMLTNHLPRIKGRDVGIWRRVVLLPWLVRFHDPTKGETGPTELTQDKDLKSKLIAELPGILAWAIRGCLAWQSQGLNPPESVVAATANFQTESDELKDFLTDRCVIDPNAEIQARFLYLDYQQWCAQTGLNPDTETTFGKKMKERGYKDKRKSDGKYRLGIRLKTPTSPPTPPIVPAPPAPIAEAAADSAIAN